MIIDNGIVYTIVSTVSSTKCLCIDNSIICGFREALSS